MTTQRIKEQVSKYVFALEYVRDKCGKSGDKLVTAEFRRDTGLNAVAVKGMLHFGYIKKISRGKYVWSAPDVVQPIMARNVYEYVKEYFRNNHHKRNESFVEQEVEQPIENPIEDVHEEPDYVSGLIGEVHMLERMNEKLNNALESVIKDRDMYRSMYDSVVEELSEMKDNHNAIVKDIMETPFVERIEEQSRTYYFFGLPVWKVKTKENVG